MHLVDDEETARQIVSRCAAKGYGLSRAKQALYEKKIPKCYWDTVLTEYPDQTEHMLRFLRSRLEDTSDQKEVKKAIDALLRRGHSYGTVRQVLNRLSFDSEEYFED